MFISIVQRLTFRPGRKLLVISLVVALLGVVGVFSALAVDNIVGGFNINGEVPDAGTTIFTDTFGSDCVNGMSVIPAVSQIAFQS